MFGPWAIREESLTQIHTIYQSWVAGEKTEWLKAYQESGAESTPRTAGYSVSDGVAVIPIEGTLARRMNMLSAYSGGQSYQMLSAAVDAALADGRVDGIVLAVDSAGGEVYGLEPVAQRIRAARKVKPIVAWSDSMALSAAYWLASATSRIYAGARSADFGSIGVAAVHVDTSKAQEAAGIKRTDLYSGKYKRIVSENKPLDEEGKAYIQAQLDDAYSVFVDAVAANRGVDAKTALEDMADGRVFNADRALAAGLIDEIASLDKAMADVRAEAAGRRRSKLQERIRAMDKATLKAENSALFEEIRAEGVAEGLARGMTEERTRIAAIQAAALPGQDDVVAKCIADGTSVTDAMAAMLADARDKRQAQADARMNDESAPLAHPGARPGPASAGGKPPATPADAMAKALADSKRAQAYMAEQEKLGITVTASEAVAHIRKQQEA